MDKRWLSLVRWNNPWKFGKQEIDLIDLGVLPAWSSFTWNLKYTGKMPWLSLANSLSIQCCAIRRTYVEFNAMFVCLQRSWAGCVCKASLRQLRSAEPCSLSYITSLLICFRPQCQPLSSHILDLHHHAFSSYQLSCTLWDSRSTDSHRQAAPGQHRRSVFGSPCDCSESLKLAKFLHPL